MHSSRMKKVIYKEIEITNKRISRPKYALLLLLIALIGVGAIYLLSTPSNTSYIMLSYHLT